jgi:glutaminyl-peptide cyclotransferase
MRTDPRKFLIFITASILLSLIISCSGKASRKDNPGTEVPSGPAAVPGQERLFTLVSPEEDASLKLGTAFRVSVSFKGSTAPDSVRVSFDGRRAGIIRPNADFSVSSGFLLKTGRKALKAVAFKGGEAVQTITRFVIVYSDAAPKKQSYKVIKIYPHDREAFTQGLVYDNGVLYEGTGQETRSSLRKVKLETGQVINQLDMGEQFFGEGIALIGERIYQLTWQSKVGFVYDKSSFRQLNRIYYQTEGWGITTVGDKLLMSDGTNILHFMDPESFSEISTLEVYDNKNRVMKLNELEYINGEIWANIWMSDLIARIDPSSGKVLAYIDMKGILNDPSVDTRENVLNGIAWDKAGNRIFVTGKNWPRLFEVKITE